jgi:Heterokaryon incompatibility protein (HET)
LRLPESRRSGRADLSKPIPPNAEHFDAEKTEESRIKLLSPSDRIAAWVLTPPGWPRERHVFRTDVAVKLKMDGTSTDSGYSSKSSSGDQNLGLNDASSVSSTEPPNDNAQANEITVAFPCTEVGPYNYEVLPSPNAFRLLRIWNKTTPIKCSLEPHDLTNHPNYYALSYSWGLSEEERVPSITINVNSHPMKVTPILYKILLHLQASDQVIRLWVDALCINQCDAVDRARQVNIMANIYKNAKRVIEWVENASKSTKSSSSDLLISKIYPAFWADERTRFSNHPYQPICSSVPEVVLSAEQTELRSTLSMLEHDESPFEDDDHDLTDSYDEYDPSLNQFQIRIVDAIVQDLKASLVAFSRQFHACLVSPEWTNPSGFRTYAPSPTAESSAATPKSKPGSSSGAEGKKRSSNSQERENDEAEEQPDHPHKRQQNRSRPKEDIRSIACPFNKFDPGRFSERNTNPTEKAYRGCGRVHLTAISRLK